MKRAAELLVLVRVALLVALAGSAVMVVDYAGGEGFCAVGSGCARVRGHEFTRAFTQLFHLNIPEFGMAATLATMALTFVLRTRGGYRMLAVVSSLAALLALTFLGVQKFFIGAFCPYCIAIDVSLVFAAVPANLLAQRVRRDDAIASSLWSVLTGASRATIAWVAAAALAVGLPFLWGKYPPIAPMPPEVASEQRPGQVALVEFTDFECPFCRALHPVLEELRKAHGDRLRLVRWMNPLTIHPGAEPAALAYLCTPEAQKDGMAEALYDVDNVELTRDGVVRVGTRVGLDPQALRACMGAPETRAALDRESALFKRLNHRGLPTTYVGARAVTGLQPEKLAAYVDRELAGDHTSLPLWALLATIAAACAAAAIVSLRTPALISRGPT